METKYGDAEIRVSVERNSNELLQHFCTTFENVVMNLWNKNEDENINASQNSSVAEVKVLFPVIIFKNSFGYEV